jgi:tRNA modification GTPase
MNSIIVAAATPAISSKRAILRMSGEGCHAFVLSIAEIVEDQGRHKKIVFHEPFESLPASAYFFKKGFSYTTEEMLELHLVGNPFLLSSLMQFCLQQGLREADAGEFTRRAVGGGRLSLPQAMAVMHLVVSRSEQEHQRALQSLCHEHRDALGELQSSVHQALIQIENELDFDDLDEGLLAAEFFPQLYETLRASWATLRSPGQTQKSPKVLIWGRANSGKSTLFNALGGEALTSSEAGTTRDWLSIELEHNGYAFELVDTAGFDGPEESHDLSAKRLAEEQKEAADLQLTLGRLSFKERGVDWYSCADEVPGDHPENSFSSHSGEGLNRLRQWIWERLSDSQPLHFFSQDHCYEIDECFKTLKEDIDAGLMQDAVIWSSHLRELARLFNPLGTDLQNDDVLNDLFGQFCVGK